MRYLAALFEAGTTAGMGDRELLERFSPGLGEASSSAFEALVARHGPMVLGVCRRALADPHDVDDAFQATFLILVRKAGSLRVDDSLGRWLYGVSRKVASRVRSDAARRPRSVGEGALAWESPLPARDDPGPALDEEIGRLPRRYREAVRLCYLDGLTLREAAERVGCPVGTVGSRLSRAREILRARLVRRGFTPALMIGTWLVSGRARAAAPRVLAEVSRSPAGWAAGAVPAAVTEVAESVIREMLMTRMTLAAGALLAAAMMGLGAARACLGQDDGRAAPPPGRRSAAAATPSRADQLRTILEEFRIQQKAAATAMQAARTDEERQGTIKAEPDATRFTQRVLALAEARPEDAVAGEAATWIVALSLHHVDLAGWGAIVRRAMEILLAHHADEPRVGQLCLLMDGYASPNRDAFLERLRDRTKSREVRGLATFGLGRYLANEAWQIDQMRKSNGDVSLKSVMGGGRVELDAEAREIYRKEFVAYYREVGGRDPGVLRTRAIALLEEVVSNYADLRDLRRSCLNPGSDDPEHARTLGDAARELLADLRDLVVGKPAPEIEGTSVTGTPIRLTDYRGKVVLMVFWASWCGPCMREVPGERELARRMKGRPFTIVGINVDTKPGDALKAIAAEQMSWPHLFDGSPGMGKVVERYGVSSFPTVFILDADGVIRSKDRMETAERDKLIETLVGEHEAKVAAAAPRH